MDLNTLIEAAAVVYPVKPLPAVSTSRIRIVVQIPGALLLISFMLVCLGNLQLIAQVLGSLPAFGRLG